MKVTYLVYRPHVPCLVELSEGNPLAVVCQNDICMLKCPDELVPKALSVMGGCCGAEARSFRKATDDEIQIFNGGI